MIDFKYIWLTAALCNLVFSLYLILVESKPIIGLIFLNTAGICMLIQDVTELRKARKYETKI